MAATAPVRRKKRHYRNEAVRPVFEIECDLREDGTPYEDGDERDVVRFRDIQKLESESGFDLIRISQTDPLAALRIMLGGDFDRFWAEWRTEPFESTQQVMQDAMEHYGGTSTGNS